MAFFEKVKQIATGKTESERRQEAAANSIIRKKVMAAEFREREKANIMLAEERIRAKAQAKLKQIRTPRRFLGSVPGGAYSSPFGQPTRSMQPKQPQVVYRKKKKKKGKKKRSSYYPQQPQQQSKRWDPIFGGYK